VTLQTVIHNMNLLVTVYLKHATHVATLPIRHWLTPHELPITFFNCVIHLHKMSHNPKFD